MVLDKVKGYTEALGSERHLLFTRINMLFVGSKDIGKINALVGKDQSEEINVMVLEDSGNDWRRPGENMKASPVDALILIKLGN